MINICNKYGFDILIISGSYGGHDDTRWTDLREWHRLTQVRSSDRHAIHENFKTPVFNTR